MKLNLEQLATIVATATVVACTLVVTGRRSAEADVGALFGADSARADARSSAYVVFRRADCESRLDFLALFGRPEIAARIAARQLLLLGTASDRETARRELGTRTRGIPLGLASSRQERALLHLGARSTPLIIVFDTSGAMRFFSPGPRTPSEFARLARTLAVLDAAG